MKLNNYDFIEIDQVELNVVAEFILEAQRQGYAYNDAWDYFNDSRFERVGILDDKIQWAAFEDGYGNEITHKFDMWVYYSCSAGDLLHQELVAAAPELYEALKSALELLEHNAVDIDGEWGSGRSLEQIELDGDLNEEIIKAREALTKAKGEL
jgi:hypothetical protein